MSQTEILRVVVLSAGLLLAACEPQSLTGKIYNQNQSNNDSVSPPEEVPLPGPLSSCDIYNGNSSYAPFSNCGSYDGSGQIPCTCSKSSLRQAEVFFLTTDELNHYLAVYPTLSVEYNGPTLYTNTSPYNFMIKTTY